MDMKQTYLYDILIIGSGVAGLTSALQLDKNLRIAIISKSSLQGGASWLAQGGIAAVFDENDSPEAHVADTLAAGAGLCHEESVRFVVKNGPEVVRWLIEQGVDFTRSDENEHYHLPFRELIKILRLINNFAHICHLPLYIHLWITQRN